MCQNIFHAEHGQVNDELLHLFTVTFPDAAKLIIENSYIDDIPASIETRQEAVSLTSKIEKILESRDFKSGYTAGVDQQEKLPVNNEGRMGISEGVLGMSWMPQNDPLRI